ncbi:MAG: phage portal protein [Planctomycetota bacterium]
MVSTPQQEAVRKEARKYTSRAFDAASRGDRTSGWRAPGSSANAESQNALSLLRARSRELTRNDAYAAAAVRVIQANVVGTGIRAQLPGESEAETVWREWAETTDCDADSCHDFYGLQNLIMRSIAESGEVLVRMRPRRRADGLPVPMQLQVLEADHLDTLKDGVVDENGNRLIQGVEFDALGRRRGYWLFRTHPGDRSMGVDLNSVFVPADQILHLYRKDRPGQVRGIPWSAPVAIRLRELRDYEDAQLIRQKIAACFAAFRVEAADAFDPIDKSSDGEAKSDQELAIEFFTPGMIVDIAAGKDIKFATPPMVQGYDEFLERHLRAVAVGFGVSYESLTADLRRTSFSSGRIGQLEFQRNVGTWQRTLMIGQFCRQVWRWFQSAGALVEVDGLEGARPTWVAPKREMLDPTREIPAEIAAVRAGMKSLTQVIEATGHTREEVFALLKAERDQAQADGLTLESDPAQAKEWRMPDRAAADLT